jgi:hypothetical protein
MNATQVLLENGIVSAIDELQSLREENKRLVLERETLRREITELEIELSKTIGEQNEHR